MRKTMGEMMGMGHSVNSKAHKAMEKKEYSKNGMSSKMMAKNEKNEYGKGKKCPKCGKANCGCKY